LSPVESAWKLKLTLAQIPSGRLLPEETMKLSPISLAPAKQLVNLSETHTINGMSISLVALGGQGPMNFTLPGSFSTYKTGKFQPGSDSDGMSSSGSPGRSDIEFTSGHPFLMTDLNWGGTDMSVQLVFRDQNGEVLPQRGGGGTEGKMLYIFEPKSTSKSIEVEFIVQKQRHVEFLIAPPKPGEIKRH
jgi:hypothetical protein